MNARTLSVLFRVAAGPRRGFGHLIRCRSLAAALGVEPKASLRATPATCAKAGRLGITVVDDGLATLEGAAGQRVVVVDDPSAAHAAAWIARARRAGIPVAAIHDLGLGYVPADLGIDGSVRPSRAMHGREGDLRGPAYAILDPEVSRWRERRTRRIVPADQVLIALGGGSHVLQLAGQLSSTIAAVFPAAQIRVAAGFAATAALPPLSHGTWLEAPHGLAEALSGATMAVVAGGVTLYEACAIGVPTVATALTAAQSLTIRAVADAGATLDGGQADGGLLRIAQHVAHLLRDRRERDRAAAAGRRLVDGRGVFRVADRLRDLADREGRVRDAA